MSQENIHRQKRLLCKSYRQARKRQLDRLQYGIQQALERIEKLQSRRQEVQDE